MKFERVIVCVFCLIVFSIAFPYLSYADPIDNWHVRSSPVTTQLTALTRGNGLFVAVGYDGTIITSPDGVNWIKRLPPEVPNIITLAGITYGSGKFIAVGELWDSFGYPRGGIILSSSGGMNWTAQTYTSVGLNSVAFGNGIFVVIDDTGTGLTSPDGVNWTNGSSNLNGVIYCDGTFNSMWGNIYSTDGINWTTRIIGGLPYYSYDGFTCGKDIYVIVGACLAPGFSPCPTAELIFTSDGTNWQQTYRRDPAGTINTVTYGNDYFVAMSRERIFASPDGINWSIRQSVTNELIQGITYGNNTFVAVGSNGTILQSDFLSGNCTATLSDDLTLHVPIIDFNGTYLQGDASCQVDADGLISCKVINYGSVNRADFSDCEASTLSSDFELHIPAGIYNNISYQADFEYIPSTDGHTRFKLVNAIKN